MENQVSRKIKEVDSHGDHSEMSAGMFYLIVVIIAPIVGYIGSYINNGPGSAWGIIQIPFNTLLPGLPIGIFIAWLFTLISRGIHRYHITTATNITADIKSLNKDIYNLESKKESLTRKNIDTNSLKNKMYDKYHKQLVADAKNKVAKPLHEFMLKLKEYYNILITDIFFETADRNKVKKEMSVLINDKFPNSLRLSNKFHDEFQTLLSSFGEPEYKIKGIKDKLIFNQDISFKDIFPENNVIRSKSEIMPKIYNYYDTTTEAELGAIYNGKVAKIMEFGAFVTFLPGKDGLVHISQISNEHVEKVSDHLKVGDEVKVKLIDIDRQDRIRLSMKEVEGE